MTRFPLLLHPATVASLLVLIANDHAFKYTHPGLITGKASDFAGLILLALLVVGVAEVVRLPYLSRLSLAVCIAVGLAFAAIKLDPDANALAELALGGEVRMDAWDLVAVPALAVPFLVVKARARIGSGQGDRNGTPFAATVVPNRSLGVDSRRGR